MKDSDETPMITFPWPHIGTFLDPETQDVGYCIDGIRVTCLEYLASDKVPDEEKYRVLKFDTGFHDIKEVQP